MHKAFESIKVIGKTEAQALFLKNYFYSFGTRVEGDKIIDIETGKQVATLKSVVWEDDGDRCSIAKIELISHSPIQSCNVNILI